MKFGVLGYRHSHIEIFVSEMIQMGHEFLGVCEKVPELAKDLAERYNVPLFSEEEQLFALKPDIIGTSAINNQKIEVIEACRSHGIHIMADKPIVTNMKDYNRLVEIIKEGSIQIGMMLTERFNPPIFSLYNLIKEGKLGKIINLSIMKPHKLNAPSRSDWHFSKEENGGIIIDLLIHDFDLLRWLTGCEVAECMGYVKKGEHKNYPDFYDSVQLTVRMDNDVTATLESDWWIPDLYRNYGDGRIFCAGTEGRVEVRTVEDLTDPNRKPVTIFMDNDGSCTTCDEASIPTSITEDFINRIEGKGDPIITHTDIMKCTYETLIADQGAKEIKKTW